MAGLYWLSCTLGYGILLTVCVVVGVKRDQLLILTANKEMSLAYFSIAVHHLHGLGKVVNERHL